MATKRRPKKRNKRKGPSEQTLISQIAQQLARGEYRAPIAAAKQNVDTVQRTRPSIEDAYAAMDQNLAGAKAQNQVVSAQAQEAYTAPAGALADGQAQLGGQMLDEASERARLFGQSMKAAEDVAAMQGSAAAQLHVGAQGGGAYLSALGQAMGGQLDHLRTATDMNEQTAIADNGEQLKQALLELAGVKSDRGRRRTEITEGMLSDKREYDLALETLGQKDKDSKREYRLDLKALKQRAKEFGRTQDLDESDTAADNARADRAQDETERHNKQTEQAAKLKAYGKTVGDDGKVKLDISRRKETMRVSPSVYLRTQDVTVDLKSFADKVSSGNPADASRLAPWQREVGRYLATGKPIPKRYLNRVRSMYDGIGGRLPREIALKFEK